MSGQSCNGARTWRRWSLLKFRRFKAFNLLGGVIYSLCAENVLKRKFCIEIWKYQIIFVSLYRVCFIVHNLFDLLWILGGVLAVRRALFCRKICKCQIIFVPLQSKTGKIFTVKVKMGRLAGMRACFCMCFVKCTLQIISNYDKFLQILSNYLHISDIFCNFASSFGNEPKRQPKS